jgi:hypothetical protein
MRVGAISRIQIVVMFALIWLVQDARAELVYFQAAELPGRQEHHDSFVVPISDPADISHARQLISKSPDEAGATILFADIVAGADGINRDWLATDQHLWNWHVTKVTGSGDFGIESLDGWPSFVEQDVAGWIKNTNGRIGFWNYTIVSELREFSGPMPQPIPASGILPAALAMMLVVVGLTRCRKTRHYAITSIRHYFAAGARDVMK